MCSPLEEAGYVRARIGLGELCGLPEKANWSNRNDNASMTTEQH
jgi:hypothetical protein